MRAATTSETVGQTPSAGNFTAASDFPYLDVTRL
jgi:hypothetical protein